MNFSEERMTKLFTWIGGVAFMGALFSLVSGHFEGNWGWISIPYIWEPKFEQAIAFGVVSIAAASFMIWDEVCKLHATYKKK
jgi:hypothetical protein